MFLQKRGNKNPGKNLTTTNTMFLHTTMLTGLIFWKIHGSRSELFTVSSATTDYLGVVSSFTARSRIECASQCFLKMNLNLCTAFALDANSKICTCGKKRFAPAQDTGSNTMIHISSGCPKIQTGKLTAEESFCVDKNKGWPLFLCISRIWFHSD